MPVVEYNHIRANLTRLLDAIVVYMYMVCGVTAAFLFIALFSCSLCLICSAAVDKSFAAPCASWHGGFAFLHNGR